MKRTFIIALCSIVCNICSAQLQIKPPGADTMSNAAMAQWYTGKYEVLLALTPAQKKKVYQALVANRNSHDSLLQIKNIRTEDLAANTFALDEQLKTLLTDAQYHDYLRTSQLTEWRGPKQ